MRILILGCGLVGSAIAADLLRSGEYEIRIADIDQDALAKLKTKHAVETIVADLSDLNRVKELAIANDLIISAVPGFLGHQTLKAVLETGRDIVDITFAAEDFLKLDVLAKEKGATAICDIGVAPGMSNLLGAYLAAKLDVAEKLVIYVGGLTKKRVWPFEYKAVFSPSDLVEEYTRPARFVSNNNLVIKPALTDLEIIEFDEIGSLEAFNSDGLRSMLDTMKIPDMVEKTLRYPGHVHKVEVLRDAGFLGTEPINVRGHMIKPADLTAKLLFPILKPEEGDRDITVMRIEVSGKLAGIQKKLRFDLYDVFDENLFVHSMARTTGYTAVMAAKAIASGRFSKPGVTAPEMLAGDETMVEYILNGLKDHGIDYRYSETDM